jgi:hypothetical protein
MKIENVQDRLKHTKMKDIRGMLNYDKIFLLAVQVGCHPFWYDGIFGPAWHCGCDDTRHGCDQQCSMITKNSLMRK